MATSSVTHVTVVLAAVLLCLGVCVDAASVDVGTDAHVEVTRARAGAPVQRTVTSSAHGDQVDQHHGNTRGARASEITQTTKDLVKLMKASAAYRATFEGFKETMNETMKTLREEVQVCRTEIDTEIDHVTAALEYSIHNRVMQTMLDRSNTDKQYTPCDVGKVAAAIDDLKETDQSCVGNELRKEGLFIKIIVHEGVPKVKLACSTPSCYSCLAKNATALDEILDPLTLGKMNKRKFKHPLEPAPTYFGNHQLMFDGKDDYVSLPRFASESHEFTFEAWVAWMPQFEHRTNGPTVRLFDFFADDQSRKHAHKHAEAEWRARALKLKNMDANGEKAWQAKLAAMHKVADKELAAAKDTRKDVHAELMRQYRRQARPVYNPLLDIEEDIDSLLSQPLQKENPEDSMLTTAPRPSDRRMLLDGTEPPNPDPDVPQAKHGDYFVHFKDSSGLGRGEWSTEAVTGISFSPGEYRDPSKKYAIDDPAVGMRVTIDKMELICPDTVPMNEWTHVSVVIHRQGSSKHDDCCWNVMIYFNGDLKCHKTDFPLSKVHMERIMWMVNSNFIGRDQAGNKESYFQGYLDEVRVWSTARTPAQLRAYMNKPLPQHQEDLIGYYRFDELTYSGRVYDISDKHNDGHLGTAHEAAEDPTRVAMRGASLPDMPA